MLSLLLLLLLTYSATYQIKGACSLHLSMEQYNHIPDKGLIPRPAIHTGKPYDLPYTPQNTGLTSELWQCLSHHGHRAQPCFFWPRRGTTRSWQRFLPIPHTTAYHLSKEENTHTHTHSHLSPPLSCSPPFRNTNQDIVYVWPPPGPRTGPPDRRAWTESWKSSGHWLPPERHKSLLSNNLTSTEGSPLSAPTTTKHVYFADEFGHEIFPKGSTWRDSTAMYHTVCRFRSWSNARAHISLTRPIR